MLGMFFDVFLFILTHISLVQFSQVVQKQTLGGVVKWPVIWWPVVSEILVPKIVKIGEPFFKWQPITFTMFFPVTVYNKTAWTQKKKQYYFIAVTQ